MPAKKKTTDAEFVRMYYHTQYERIKAIEDHALTISNIVLTVSALIITFGYDNQQAFGRILVLFLPSIIIITNVSAIFYISDNSRWIQLHQSRAHKILEVYAPELHTLNADVPSKPNKGVSRIRIQSLIHYLFVFLGSVSLVIFILQLLGVAIM
ncbi:MAG: hypothetical protein U0V18_08190 [Anaerolineales bacterium]